MSTGGQSIRIPKPEIKGILGDSPRMLEDVQPLQPEVQQLNSSQALEKMDGRKTLAFPFGAQVSFEGQASKLSGCNISFKKNHGDVVTDSQAPTVFLVVR